MVSSTDVEGIKQAIIHTINTKLNVNDNDVKSGVSIGTELKFVSLWPSNASSKEEKEAKLDQISVAIKERGQKAVSKHRLSGSDRAVWDTHWIVKSSNSSSPDPVLDIQRGLLGSNDLNLSGVGVEASSPKFVVITPPKPNTTPKKTPAAPPHISAINATINSVKSVCKAYVNHTCDVHFHLGRPDGIAFALPTLKRIAVLCWLIEPLLFKLRDPCSPNVYNKYTWGAQLQDFSRLESKLTEEKIGNLDELNETLAKEVREKREGIKRYLLEMEMQGKKPNEDKVEQHVRNYKKIKLEFFKSLLKAGHFESVKLALAQRHQAAINCILEKRTAQELGLIMSGEGRPHRRGGINMSCFGLEDNRARNESPRTIEFRFFEGSLDKRVIQANSALCVAIIRAAVGATNKDRAAFNEAAAYAVGCQDLYSGTHDLMRGKTWSHHFGELCRILNVGKTETSVLKGKIAKFKSVVDGGL